MRNRTTDAQFLQCFTSAGVTNVLRVRVEAKLVTLLRMRPHSSCGLRGRQRGSSLGVRLGGTTCGSVKVLSSSAAIPAIQAIMFPLGQSNNDSLPALHTVPQLQLRLCRYASYPPLQPTLLSMLSYFPSRFLAPSSSLGLGFSSLLTVHGHAFVFSILSPST